MSLSISDIVESYEDTMSSLEKSIAEAGGTPLSTRDLKTMSAYELICDLCATNGIRFIYDPNKCKR